MSLQANFPLANGVSNRMISNLTSFVPPVTLYFGLYTATPDVSIGSIGTEVVGGGYARVARTCNLTNFSATNGKGTTTVSSGTLGIIYNNNEIIFPTPTAAWGTVTTIVVLDSLTSTANANIWFVSPITPTSLFVASGSVFSLLPGQWSLGLS